MARRAVVLLEPDLLRAGEVALEAQDVLHLRAAPAVDRLVVVADGADVPLLAGEELQELELRDVRVLVLVDEQVAEAPRVASCRSASSFARSATGSAMRSSKSTARCARERALVAREDLARDEVVVVALPRLADADPLAPLVLRARDDARGPCARRSARSSTFTSRMQRFTSAIWSPASQMAKRFGSPAAACSCCSSHRPKLWKVETKTSTAGRARDGAPRARASRPPPCS